MRTELNSNTTLRDINTFLDQQIAFLAPQPPKPPETTASPDGIELVQQEFKIDFYGNYCGPGNGTGVEKPVDKIDADCMKHDAAYGKFGYFDIKSDLMLQGRLLRDIFTADLSWQARCKAALAVVIFAFVSPISFGTSVFRDGWTSAKESGHNIASGAKSLAKGAWNAATSWY